MDEIKHQDYWNKSAVIYDDIIQEELHSFKKEAWQSLLKEHLADDRRSLQILDVGTGPGFFSIILSQMGHQVTGIDFSKEMIETAKKNSALAHVQPQFIHVTGDSSFNPVNTFDIILSRNVTWTLHRPEKVYSDWHKWLKKDGKLIIFDANWNLPIANEQYGEMYQKDVQEAIKHGFPQYKEEELFKEGDEISTYLPMTYAMRPEWDRAILFQLGFRHIKIRQDFDKRVYTEAEQIAYKSIPSFSITGIK
ncbi:class I SAM-dependent methyltransferase [Halalkalibacter oceani]|uniref:Class I SAM-dependent methyltransferase n=1 Tax=Halalkalibacter oceani TaxID=1653776 RepID=A0A9X2IM17_9BACI|nr:class I SAM-dependent methyltransferase [Halalkalibacter oceani]MCM3713434.1 class I SAM-dependent methyltransferase [Halalkalibacter oceani]